MSRRIISRRRPDETASLAGWLYTDLLLGLAVVFLGATAFAAAKKPDPVAVPATTTTTTTTTVAGTPTTLKPKPKPPATTIPKPCTLQQEPEKNANRITINDGSDQQLIDSYNQQTSALLAARGLPEMTPVGFAIVWGGGNGSQAGESLAQNFGDKLAALVPERFGASTRRGLYNNALPANRYNIDVFFKVGDC